MKLTIVSLAVGCVLLSCGTQPSAGDVDTATLFDMTDKVVAFPTASDLLSPFDLKHNPYQSIRLRLTTISEKDYNPATCLTLDREDEWQSNTTIRNAKIQHFSAQVQQRLDAIRHTDTSGHSIIYRAIVAQANELARSRAKRRVLVVYSNLYENSGINFYDPATLRLLRDKPGTVQRQLEREEPIQPLGGLEVWLVYDPSGYRDNNHFRPIARLYQRMLQQHGATVHIGTQFQPQ